MRVASVLIVVDEGSRLLSSFAVAKGGKHATDALVEVSLCGGGATDALRSSHAHSPSIAALPFPLSNMGRRPNALVTEYFVRGEKLVDASNRYAHTCRRCGEYFAKGRVEALFSHLIRRCPGVPQDERDLVYHTVQQQDSEVSRIIRSKQPRHVSHVDQACSPFTMPGKTF